MFFFFNYVFKIFSLWFLDDFLTVLVFQFNVINLKNVNRVLKTPIETDKKEEKRIRIK